MVEYKKELSVKDALNLLQRNSKTTYDDAINDSNFYKGLALSGQCGRCEFLNLQIKSGKLIIECMFEHDPERMYGNVSFGEEPFCEDFMGK